MLVKLSVRRNNSMTPMNLCKPAFAITLIILGGCATIPKTDTQFLVKPFTVRLAEIPLTDRDAVRSMVALDLTKDSAQVDQETSNVIEAAQSQALVDMTSAFRALLGFHVDSSPLALPRSLEGFPVTDRNQPLAQMSWLRYAPLPMPMCCCASEFLTTA